MKPLFVAISDVHFNVNNLDLATKALKSAMDKAAQLDVSLIVAGDLHDTKAIIRAEVQNTLIQLFKNYKSNQKTYIIVGNHDLINEKGSDHGLNYLKEYATVIDAPSLVEIDGEPIRMLPYTYNFTKELINQYNSRLIVMHQGVKGAFMGEYVQDKSSIDPEIFDNFKVFSGHYHRHQVIRNVTYLGSPFTHSFAERNDGPKGFLVVFKDGTFEHIPLNLRKHIIIEGVYVNGQLAFDINAELHRDDVVWVKLTGSRSALAMITRKDLLKHFKNNEHFKLEFVFLDQQVTQELKIDDSPEIIIDRAIDSLNDTDEHKEYLKFLYRSIL